MLFFSFLVSTDVTNLFRQRFHKPCADENVSSAISCLHISLPSLPRASTLVGLGDVLPRPRCRGCFFYLMGELLCFFVASTKLPRNFPSAVLPHPSARAATRTYSPCYDSTNTTEDKWLKIKKNGWSILSSEPRHVENCRKLMCNDLLPKHIMLERCFFLHCRVWRWLE